MDRKTLSLIGLWMLVASLASAQSYTRGIGVYPGDPAQCDAPRLVPGGNERRCLSLHRITTASSQFDNNLTAQLATDGIVSDGMPNFLRVSTPAGLVSRREREWSLDECIYTHNVLPGADSYLQYDLQGWTVMPDSITLEGQVAYHPDRVAENDTWSIALEVSADGGQTWRPIASQQGRGLLGSPSSARLHDDPDKRLGQGPLPTRNFNQTLKVKTPSPTGNRKSGVSDWGACDGGQKGWGGAMRLHVTMPSASHWAIMCANMYRDGALIDMKPAQYFHSSWMSAPAGKQAEWLMVDLGASSDIDEVKLHWIQRATKGSIQLSDDAQRWRTVASLTGADNETIPCRGRGRYVRVLMQQGVAPCYVLSEMQVWGRGGLRVEPQQAPAAQGDTLMLSRGEWRIHRPSAEESIQDILSADYNDRTPSWLVATVPGTALVSYMNAGAVPNTNYANMGLHISESYFRSNFWYRRTFTLPQGFRRERLYLNFDGINWKARVWLNGHYLGLTEGAFIRTQYEVSRYATEGDNVLVVECICNAHYGAAKEKNAMNTAINGGILGADNPTFHATVGWDWINSTRGREVGIWNDVYLTTCGALHLSDPFVECTLNLPDTTLATLRPQVVVRNDGARSVTQRLVGRIGDVEFGKMVTIPAGETRTVVFEPEEFPQLVIRNPHLWWPNGYGEPYLYEASFKASPQLSPSGREVVLNYKTGIRQITWNTANDKLTLFVNGRRFVGKGGNWGFSEHNLLYRGREYDAAVRYHREMNFTMIRNWVGQIGDDEFYDACDRYGIMVWQDFWLANPCDGPDPDDEAMFARNAEDMVSRIRRHPSLALYCGRNEGFPPATLNAALRRIVLDVHPGLPYIGSSADDVVSGHGPYWAITPKEYFELTAGADKFHSERGMPNVMNYESLCRALAPETLWPQGNAWGEHDYTLEGAQRGASFNQMLEDMFGPSRNAREFCDRAQWINYDGYRALFESRSRYRRGLLLWMTHPCWPSMVWQTYDYYLQPTAAYFGARKGCEPLHIQWNAATDSIEVVNYSAGSRRLQAVATLYDVRGNALWSTTCDVDSREDTTLPCAKFIKSSLFKGETEGVRLLRLQLLQDGQVISHNDYIIGREATPTLARLPQTRARMTLVPMGETNDELLFEARLTNTTRTVCPMQRIQLCTADGQEVLPVIYSDNYVHLLPGETRTITIRCRKADTHGSALSLR